MTYEVHFMLSANKGGAADALEYASYFNEYLGQGQWLPLQSLLEIETARDNGEPVCLLCPYESLVKLKWADIVGGCRRMSKERELSADELSHYRTKFGELFPWEQLVD